MAADKASGLPEAWVENQTEVVQEGGIPDEATRLASLLELAPFAGEELTKALLLAVTSHLSSEMVTSVGRRSWRRWARIAPK